jgi:hypothetical protein
MSQQVDEKFKAENGGKSVTTRSHLVPRVVCQRFRNNEPVTCQLLTACFDPKANSKLRLDTLKPHHLVVRNPSIAAVVLCSTAICLHACMIHALSLILISCSCVAAVLLEKIHLRLDAIFG